MAVGEPEKDNSPVDCYPGERPSQEGLGRYASDAGIAKRRDGAKKAPFADLTTLRRKEFEQFSLGPLCVARESPE